MKSRFVELTGDADKPALPVEVEDLGEGRWRVTLDGVAHEVEAVPTEQGIALVREGRSADVPLELRADGVHRAHLWSGTQRVHLMEERLFRLQQALGGGPGQAEATLKSPMAGKVVLIPVAVGDEVEEGQTLIIIEAMKMENEIRAVAAAPVKAIHVAAGDTVDPGTVLMEFDIE